MKLLAIGFIVGSVAVTGAHAAPIRVEAVAPATVGVGDPIAYTVVVRLPARTVDAASLQIFADTGPFTQIGPTTTTRRTEGDAVVVTLEQRLACLDLPCAPGDGAARIRLPVAHAAARLRAGRGTSTGRGNLVTIAVAPRVSRADVHAITPTYRQQTALPVADVRAARLVAPFGFATAGLALVAVALALVALRPRSHPPATEPELARAVRLLRESATRPVPDRRRAADFVGRAAASAGSRALADDASHLAWSARAPGPRGTAALADRVEETKP